MSRFRVTTLDLHCKERHALPAVTFMQDGDPLHFARKVKEFHLDTFSEDLGCNFEVSSRSPKYPRQIFGSGVNIYIPGFPRYFG